MNRTWCAVLVFVLGLVVAGSASAQAAADETGPITWEIVKTSVPVAPVRVGEAFTVELKAHIERGWHLYSLTPVENGPRPTRIMVAAGQGFELAGPVKAPEPTTAMDPNFKVETEFYDEAVTFTVPIRARPDAAAGKSTVTVQVRFQTCNDRDCLPPALVKLPVQVEVAQR